MMAGLLASLIEVWQRPERGIMARDGGFWAGIYFNRNSLAPVAALAIICAVLLMAKAIGARLVGGAASFTIAAIVLAETQARTALAALVGSLAVVGMGAVLVRRREGTGRGRDMAAAAVGTLVVATVASIQLFDRAIAAVGVDPTLDNRTPLWNFVRMEIGRQPFQGYGFYGYWIADDNYGRIQGWLVWFPPSAHNGFLEVALGLGYVGAALLAVALVWAAVRTARAAWFDRRPTALFGVAMVAFFVLTDLTESFTLPNQFIWALFVAAAVGGNARPRVSHE
jgi:O-antigen ligase